MSRSDRSASSRLAAAAALAALLALAPATRAQDGSSRSNRPTTVQTAPAKPFTLVAKPVQAAPQPRTGVRPASPAASKSPGPAPFAPAFGPVRAIAGEGDALERIRKLEQAVAEAGRDLARLEPRRAELAARCEEISIARDRAGDRALGLVRTLWPAAAVRLDADRAAPALRSGDWAEDDRRLWWLAAVTEQAEPARRAYAEQSAKLAAVRAEIEAVDADISRLGRALVQGRRDLAEARGAVVSAMQRERGADFDLASAVVGLAGPQPGTAGLPGLEEARGLLPWPVAGRLADPPAAGPGLAFATEPGTPVASVQRGAVAFAGPVEGLGDVVAVDHGRGWYSIYACLDRSGGQAAEPGQLVEPGQALGAAAECPFAGGRGVYFELLFGKKVINPGLWLAAGP